MTPDLFQVSYENRIDELQRDIQQLSKHKQDVETEYSTLKKTVKSKEEEGRKRLSMMEVSLPLLDHHCERRGCLTRQICHGYSIPLSDNPR